MAMARVSSSLVPAVTAMQHAHTRVAVPTREEARVAVTEVRDALDSLYLSSQSMRARATASSYIDNRAMTAYRLLKEVPETQEVVAEVVSDCNVFAAIWAKVQEIPAFRIVVDSFTSCLLPRDCDDLPQDDGVRSVCDRPSWWTSMFKLVVEAVSGIWSQLLDLFCDTIPRIQSAFAQTGGAAGEQYALETAILITGLTVLVITVIVVGAFVTL